MAQVTQQQLDSLAKRLTELDSSLQTVKKEVDQLKMKNPDLDLSGVANAFGKVDKDMEALQNDLK